MYILTLPRDRVSDLEIMIVSRWLKNAQKKGILYADRQSISKYVFAVRDFMENLPLKDRDKVSAVLGVLGKG